MAEIFYNAASDRLEFEFLSFLATFEIYFDSCYFVSGKRSVSDFGLCIPD